MKNKMNATIPQLESLLKSLKSNPKPTKRQKKIYEILLRFGVVSIPYKNHSELVETLDESL